MPRFGKLVSPDNIRTLISSQLLPLGLLRLADGSQPEVRKADPLLGMRFRYTVTDPNRTRTPTIVAAFSGMTVGDGLLVDPSWKGAAAAYRKSARAPFLAGTALTLCMGANR